MPNWLELQGIRLGNGTIVTTDPADFDTDGDGLSDGEEVGTRQTGPDGDYYDGITDPTNADTDGDGLDDADEVYGITNPVNADTDGDGLDDALELDRGFDPLNVNPDGDSFSDAAEYQRGSDPFTYDLTGWEYAAAVVAGFTIGDAGQNMVDLGWLNPAHLQSFGYIAGWLASGFFVIGDIRDTLASLVRGDIADTFLNAIGLIPLLGDGTKVVRVVGTYLGWLSEMKVALGRWLFKQFEDAQQLRIVALPLFGYTDEITVLLTKSDADELIAKGNDLDAIKALTARHPGKLSLSTRLPDMIDWGNVDDARKLHWPDVQGREFAQAESTEAAVEYGRLLYWLGEPDYSEHLLYAAHTYLGTDSSAYALLAAGNLVRLAGDTQQAQALWTKSYEAYQQIVPATGKQTVHNLQTIIETCFFLRRYPELTEYAHQFAARSVHRDLRAFTVPRLAAADDAQDQEAVLRVATHFAEQIRSSRSRIASTGHITLWDWYEIALRLAKDLGADISEEALP